MRGFPSRGHEPGTWTVRRAGRSPGWAAGRGLGRGSEHMLLGQDRLCPARRWDLCAHSRSGRGDTARAAAVFLAQAGAPPRSRGAGGHGGRGWGRLAGGRRRGPPSVRSPRGPASRAGRPRRTRAEPDRGQTPTRPPRPRSHARDFSGCLGPSPPGGTWKRQEPHEPPVLPLPFPVPGKTPRAAAWGGGTGRQGRWRAEGRCAPCPLGPLGPLGRAGPPLAWPCPQVPRRSGEKSGHMVLIPSLIQGRFFKSHLSSKKLHECLCAFRVFPSKRKARGLPGDDELHTLRRNQVQAFLVPGQPRGCSLIRGLEYSLR